MMTKTQNLMLAKMLAKQLNLLMGFDNLTIGVIILVQTFVILLMTLVLFCFLTEKMYDNIGI